MEVSEHDHLAESDLVVALKRGESFAFNYAVRRYSDSMLYAAMAFLDRDTAEDVVQETWCAVVEVINQFEGRSSLKTWLCTVSANRAKNRLRKAGREVNLQQDTNFVDFMDNRFKDGGSWSQPMAPMKPDTVMELMEGEALKNCIDKHIAALPELLRSVITLSDLHQLSNADICRILDLPANNIRVALHRARQRLMLMVENYQVTGGC